MVLRKESNRYNKKVEGGWWEWSDEESTFDPDSSWGHIFYMMVHGVRENQWWTTKTLSEAEATGSEVRLAARLLRLAVTVLLLCRSRSY